MSKSILQPTKEKTNGTKLRRLLLDGGTQVLRNVFDSIHPPSTLSGVLKGHETDLRKKCFDDQIELLFPSDGQPADSKTFDITLLSSLLQKICNLTAPTTGWNKKPLDSDKSQEANIVRIRLFRNKIQHPPDSGISDTDFEELWKEISAPLTDLGLEEGIIKRLKIAPIGDEFEIQERFQRWCDLSDKVEDLQKNQKNILGDVGKLKGDVEELQVRQMNEGMKEPTQPALQSSIPDEPVKFVGRKGIIKDILETLNQKTSSILVYGSPGIGKSTLAKKVSWELSHKHQEIVFYIDLWKCTASEEEISKAVVSVLCRGRTETNPIETLDSWLRSLQINVVLVLDNVEDVLDNSSTFASVLMKIRQNSSQRVSFLIASRDIVHLEIKIKDPLELKPLTNEESVEVINLHSTGKHFSSNMTQEQKQKIAELCCHTPLALCIVTSLLDDLKAGELIKQLKTRVMDVLEGEERRGRCCSVQEAIQLSFDKLDDGLRGYFVQITVFAGPFTAESARAVIELPKLDAVKTLRKLVRKSLLQKEGDKYSIHPLIHTFVKDYGKRNKPEKLKTGDLNFVNHYASLFLANAHLYWKEDGCLQAISNFEIDRINFEKALDLSCLNGERDDLQAVWIEENACKELRDLALYLQSCISWDLLEKVISCFLCLCEKKNIVGQQLELICLKGHIIRRKSGNEQYEAIVKQADELFERCKDKLDVGALVYYKTAKARKLGHEQRRVEAIKHFEEIIEICKANIDKKPNIAADYAKAVLELGHNLKHMEEYEQALKKLHDAVNIYETHLGEHTLTALGLKDLADCYMTIGKFEEALRYNDIAYDMQTRLNSGSSDARTSILLSKNRGVCYRELKRYQKSEDILKKAAEIADKNLSGDHQYKFWVKADLAILYKDMNRKKEAKALAKEALEMGNRLNLKQSGWRTFKTELQDIVEMQE